MKYNHIGIPTTERFAEEIDLPHLKITVSDHANNPFGIQWQRYIASRQVRCRIKKGGIRHDLGAVVAPT